jgi:hypothetical protein
MSEEIKIGETCYVFGHTMRVGKVVDSIQLPELHNPIYVIRFDDGETDNFPSCNVYFTKLDAHNMISENVAYWQHEEHKMEIEIYGKA